MSAVTDNAQEVSSALSFPGAPKLELNELLRQLIDRAQDVVAVQGRLRSLLRANQAVMGNLSLPVVLRQIVEAACELGHARYGALGVIDPGGGLAQFVHVGIDNETALRIGHLPEGKGLLGALIDDPRPIRLTTMTDDPRSVGFPANHPPMKNFLGVPVRVRDEIFGNLYLAERIDGDFTPEDEELISALAGTAGVAIENARLYEEARRRQEWLQASTEVTRQLLAVEGDDPLWLIARKALKIAEAEIVTVALPTVDGQRLIIEVAAGVGADELLALTYPLENSLVGRALSSRKPILVGDVGQDEPPEPQNFSNLFRIGPVMVLPLGVSQRVLGALVIGRRRGEHRFDEADLEMATMFANHAALALELADARTDQQRIAMLEDHERIARDLHDHVIQRLFAAGLTVQSVASGLGSTDPRVARLSRTVTDIDETIRQIRTSIFQLRGPLGPETGTVRARLLTVADEVSQLLGFQPDLRFTGPVDAVVPDRVLPDLVAVLREALTNTARHAHASRVSVDVMASTTELSIIVIDDGLGIGHSKRRSGLANLRERAQQFGGSLTLDKGATNSAQPSQEGTRLQWKIPLT